jgi:hypothetical protein
MLVDKLKESFPEREMRFLRKEERKKMGTRVPLPSNSSFFLFKTLIDFYYTLVVAEVFVVYGFPITLGTPFFAIIPHFL